MIKKRRPHLEIHNKPKTSLYNDCSFYLKMTPFIFIMGILVTYIKFVSPIHKRLHGAKGNGK